MTDDNRTTIKGIHRQFPLLDQKVGGYPLVYLDNGATTQKPLSVIDAIDRYYRTINSNVHRGIHTLSQRSTDAMEAAREKVRAFINAPQSREIIFTRGTTESINLVASGYAQLLHPGDEVIVSQMEHHSNIVPWQVACGKSGATLKVIPVNDDGTLDMGTYARLLSRHTKIVSVTHTSNVLGTVNPVKEITRMAKEKGADVLIDGAQAIPHMPVDVQEIGCDFYAFSGHKMYAPTGIGILWGTEKALDRLPVYQGGGEMIKHVSFSGTTFGPIPFKFEAGTPNIEGAIGLGAAIDFLTGIGMDEVQRHDRELMDYMTEKMGSIEGIQIYGQAADKSGSFSFGIKGAHPTDIGTLLDNQGIAVRTGHHCAEPLMERFGIPGTVRASLGLYNTREDIDRLYEATLKAKGMLL